MFEKFPVEALEAAAKGLETDLGQLQSYYANVQDRVQDLHTSESRRNYTEVYRVDRLQEIQTETAGKLKEIAETALQHADEVISQERFWSADAILRKARVTAAPAKPGLDDDGFLLPREKAVRDLVGKDHEIRAELAENLARQRWLAELQLMDSVNFLATVHEAAESGDYAVLWLAQLALKARHYKSEDERDRLTREVTNTKFSIGSEERERAAQAIQAAKTFRCQIEDISTQIRGRSKNPGEWAKGILDEAGKRAARARFE